MVALLLLSIVMRYIERAVNDLVRSECVIVKREADKKKIKVLFKESQLEEDFGEGFHSFLVKNFGSFRARQRKGTT